MPRGTPRRLRFRRVCLQNCWSAVRISRPRNAAWPPPTPRWAVARAAYFPIFTLTGSGGFESTAITTLIQGPSGFLTAGAAAAVTAFDVGRRRAVSEQARAAYDESVANYRQTVLTAFQEVEDNLAVLRILNDEAKAQQAAVAAAEHSLQLSTNRYKGGVVSYLEVTTAQSTALADERAAVDILRRRMTGQRFADQGPGRRLEFRQPAVSEDGYPFADGNWPVESCPVARSSTDTKVIPDLPDCATP